MEATPLFVRSFRITESIEKSLDAIVAHYGPGETRSSVLRRLISGEARRIDVMQNDSKGSEDDGSTSKAN